MIRLGLIEDNPILLKNYIDFFETEKDFYISFALNDIPKLSGLNADCEVDIILLDLILPSGNSLNYLHHLTKRFPFSRIIILSGIADQRMSESAIQRGVNGYLLKSSSMSYIKDSLIKATEGGLPLSPLIATHVITLNKQQKIYQEHPSLTKKEIELIYLLKRGMTNKIAATELNVTYFTINQHLKHIYKKLNINSKKQLLQLLAKY